MQGELIIDEAMDLFQAVTGGNSNSMAWIMQPMLHSSTDKLTVIKHRRLLEDKLHA